MSNETITQTIRLGKRELHESIRTNIRTILLSSRGEVPFRPRFGLGAERLLGGNMTNIDLAFEVADQLNRYEKRIKLKQVMQADIAPRHRKVTIRYEILETKEEENLTF